MSNMQSAYGLPSTPVPPPSDRLAILEEALRNIEAAIARTKQ